MKIRKKSEERDLIIWTGENLSEVMGYHNHRCETQKLTTLKREDDTMELFSYFPANMTMGIAEEDRLYHIPRGSFMTYGREKENDFDVLSEYSYKTNYEHF